MGEKKSLIGLSWEPKLPPLSSSTKISNTKSQDQPERSALWKPNTELIDGLFVPPNDPRKVNRLLRSQAKDTLGKDWYAWHLHFFVNFFCFKFPWLNFVFSEWCV